MDQKEKQYLSVEEVAERFEVDPKTIYRLAQRKKIPSFKLGKQWRFDIRLLNRWIQKQSNFSV